MATFKILFVYDMPPEHALHWRDGLYGALKELEKEWEVEYINIQTTNDWRIRIANSRDFVLGWGGTGSPHFFHVSTKLNRGGWCFGGGDINNDKLDKFGIVFVENVAQLIKPHFSLAFGTNTSTFYEMSQPKIFDAIYPAAFANWKHQEKFADICEREKLKGLAVGYKQVDNEEESIHLMNYCLIKGVAVMDWVPAKSLNYLYNMSREVIITADQFGGCERAILEAKACGVSVRVVSDSQKLLDLGKLTTQEVQQNWNHFEYARKLKQGIETIL